MEKTRKKYSIEFKIKAVELSKARGSVKPIARELNIPHDNLRRWIREYDSGIFTGVGVKTKSQEEDENSRLRKELYEVKLERDILKKAVGIFSKSDR